MSGKDRAADERRRFRGFQDASASPGRKTVGPSPVAASVRAKPGARAAAKAMRKVAGLILDRALAAARPEADAKQQPAEAPRSGDSPTSGLLLSWFGTVVCLDRGNGRLVHCSFDRLGGALVPAQLDLVDDGAGGKRAVIALDGLFPHVQQMTLGAPAIAQADGLGFDVTVADSPQKIRLMQHQRYLSAHRDGSMDVSRAVAKTWETFLLVSPALMATLRQLASNAWIVRSKRQFLERGAIRLAQDFRLQIGERSVAVTDVAPLSSQGEGAADADRPTEVTVFFDGWRIEDLLLYRPLVYLVAFGRDSIFEELRLCLSSLVTLGGYDGDVLVIGDRQREALLPWIPPELHARVHTFTLRANQRPDYVAARYLLPKWAPSAGYQPFLYMDVDVIVDRPVRALLEQLPGRRRMTAQRERFSILNRRPSVGQLLFRDDGIDTGGAAGFNSGIVGIPSLREHAGTLRKIGELIYRYAPQREGKSLTHVDQPIANYVVYKLAAIDPEPVTSCVRYTHNGELCGGDQPLGFVHFWGSGPDPVTIRVMRQYLDEQCAAASSASFSAAPLLQSPAG